MTQKQINVRAGEATHNKLAALTELYGSQTQVMSVAIDRLYMSEIGEATMKMTMHQIAQEIMDNALAVSCEDFDNEFDFAATENRWTAEEIEEAQESIWYPNPFKDMPTNVCERYGDPVAVTIADYLELNPGGKFEIHSDGIREYFEDGTWELVAE